MLVELRIRDYAVVEDVTLSLGPGLNVLTGETGAGKSIVVGALSLLLGERASADVVRAGARRASVEACFDVSDVEGFAGRIEAHGIEADDGLLVLRREVAAEGRNRAWINGSPATAGLVGELGSALVDLHGQHEHQTLLKAAEQRDILDAFAGAEPSAGRVAERHGRVRNAARALEEREERRREIEGRADFLRFQLGELESAGLHPGEDEELEAEARRAEHAEELAGGAARIHDALYGGDDAVADRLAELRSALERLARADPTLEASVHPLDEAYHAAADVGRRMADYAAGVERDPARLEEVRRRLDLIVRLKRKYGPEIDDVLATGRRVREELEALDSAAHDLAELRRRLDDARAALESAAAELSGRRREAAAALAARVEETLPLVGLQGATFEVRLHPFRDIGASGGEAIEFLVAPNRGFEPMPLARIASGGELSRVMLALKAILADVDRIPVLIFDEIDAGIGGAVASDVGRTLEEVGRRHQVFAVTHLPQIACRAARHFVVEKAIAAGTVATRVGHLDGQERIREIARMLGGDPESETSRDHARELLGVG